MSNRKWMYAASRPSADRRCWARLSVRAAGSSTSTMSSFARDPGSNTTVVSTWRQLPPSGQVAPVVPLLPLPSQAAANPQTTTATAAPLSSSESA